MTGWAARFALGLAAALLALIVVYDFVNPPTTYTMWSEGRRLGGIDQEWTDAEDIAPVMLRAAVAAEDANFCNHWGFDMAAIRQAIDKGANRGASTISQQVVKNVFLWQGRSWPRKALEAMLTPPVEAIWTKRRILEIYLNVAEFGEGVFGVNAAAFHYFRTTPDKLSAHQAALLAAVLPDPKERSAAKPSRFVSRRANAIVDGAETIRRDGRARCFSD
ncbi:monofunctional biosynthetic peptidoglycan transglycosylase [Rhodobacter maris]|nr:monofunctional biosynthetic peptidoglycan transglycosylase [Rhodobacter maris]